MSSRLPASHPDCRAVLIQIVALYSRRLQARDPRNQRNHCSVKAPWRETMVVNLSRDAVELQFLDMPRAPYVSRIFKASWSRMKVDKKRYRFVRGPK